MKPWLLRLVRLLGLVMLIGLSIGPAHACSSGACVSAGPRLASVDSTRGALLNTVLGSLAGTTLSLNVADWNALATGNLSLASTVNALQATLGVSSPTTALSANASLAQVLGAAVTAATGENKTALAAAIGGLQLPLQLLGGSIRLGDLLVTDGALGSTRVDALEFITGVIQLYNTRNVLSTPSAITVSGTQLGIAGLASQVTLAAQVVEPPVFVCGGVGSTFHSATIRVKLGLELLSLTLDPTLLKLIPLVSTVSAQLAHLDLYVEVARADGIISSINAISNAFSVQATPGVADLYLGLMNDNVFFNRSHAINPATDLGWSTIGAVTINTISVALRAKASARGSGSAGTLNFSAPYPQGGTVSAGAGFVTNLLISLAANLQISLSAGLGVLEAPVGLVLGPLLQLLLPGVVQPLIDGLVDPLLGLLGVRLGEVDVNGGGTMFVCSVSGSVYDDSNHSAKLEPGEAGTGATLYAKLLASGQSSGSALAVATVDATTGAWSFPTVASGSYVVIVNTTATASQLTPAAPSGWIATETPTLSRTATLTTADLTAQRFGLYHGSKLTGSVFKDDGSGAGAANNGVRDGTETTLTGVGVKLANAALSVVYDTATSGDNGAYTLWIPSSAGTLPLKVVQSASAAWVMISGNVGTTAGVYTQAASTVTFTHALGSLYSGVNFGNVGANRFEPDGQQQIVAGSVAFFAHTFVAGSGGQVAITAAGNGAAGWASQLYADANCSGKLEAGETALAAAVPVVAYQKVCIVARITSPASAPINAQYPLALTAHFAYVNNALTSVHLRNDLVSVGSATDAGLRLLKSVDKAAAASGEIITYTVTYTNQSSGALTTLKIQDATPAYTVFAAASCGAAPNVSISCAVTTVPAVGQAGRIEWTFTGTLSAGASGTVTWSVLLN